MICFLFEGGTLLLESIRLDENCAVLLESVYLKELNSHNRMQAHIHFCLHPISN